MIALATKSTEKGLKIMKKSEKKIHKKKTMSKLLTNTVVLYTFIEPVKTPANLAIV